MAGPRSLLALSPLAVVLAVEQLDWDAQVLE